MEVERLNDRWVAELTLGETTYTLSLESDFPNMKCSRVDIWDGAELVEELEYDFKLLACNRVYAKKDLNNKSKPSDF